jgi:hypothetical protein
MNAAAGGRPRGLRAFALAFALVSRVAVAAGPTVVLELPHGGGVEGVFGGAGPRVADGTATVRVEAAMFAGPLDMCVDAFERVRFLPEPPPPERRPAWRIHLRSGDVVAGELGAIDGERVRVTLPGTGSIALRRSHVSRVERIVRTEEVVPAHDVVRMKSRDGWSSVGGRLVCETAGGSVSRNVPVADRAVFDVELSWRERPDFDLDFATEKPAPEGVRDTKPGVDEVYRVEATGGVARAIRQGAGGMTHEIATLPRGPGGLTIRCFIDQKAGRIAVVLPAAADRNAVPAIDSTQPLRQAEAGPRSGFTARLRRGDLCIERLRVLPWESDAPRLDEPSIGGAGETVEAFDGAAATFVVRTGDATRRVAAADVRHVWLAAADPVAPPRDAVVAVLADGSRLTGELLGLDDRGLRLASAVVEEPITVEIARLAAIEAVRAGDVRGLPGTVGRLDDVDLTMLGCLADVGGIGWHALGAASPVAFAGPDAAARIAYRGVGVLGGAGVSLARRGDEAWEVVDVVAGGPAARDGRLRIGNRAGSIAQGRDGEAVRIAPLKLDAVRALVRGPVGSMVRLEIVDDAEARSEIVLVRDESGCDDLAGAAPKDVLDRALALQQSLARSAAATGPATLHLRGGDAIACTLVSADGEHVVVRLGEDGEARVPSRLVRALELLPVGVRPLLKQKLERLLTVPRSQRDTPPTHVVRMAAGDYLRGRLLAVDADVVRFDVAGDVKPLRRRDVARIIWLTSAGEPAPAPRAAVAGLPGVPIVAIGTDGRRLTLAATGVEGADLVGESLAFGRQRVPVARCAALLVGRAIDEHAAAELPYAQWVLTPAPAPGRSRR